MSKSKISVVLLIAFLAACAVQSFGQTIPPKSDEGKLIAVLKSDATRQEKVAACRQLAVIGTKDAVAPLAALLSDEELSHMARYALEPIPDPAADEALRDALGKLKGRPLVGVIGSIGVRRDRAAVGSLAGMLADSDVEVARAAARALGSIGGRRATRALQGALPNAPAANKLALCEGLFRCAERLVARDRRDVAIEIYDQLRSADAPHQVRGGALRGAILTRGADGIALLREHLHSDDYVLFSAAVQASQELPGAEVIKVLSTELSKLPADNQILVMLALGWRADPAALPALFAAAKSGAKSTRIAATRALPEIGHASAVPVLVDLLTDADREISQTAQESLAALPGAEADAVVMAMFASDNADRRLAALDLMERRRMTDGVSVLLRAAGDADSRVRPAAIEKVGALGGPGQLPALLDLLGRLERPRDLDATRQALSDVCAKADDPQSCAGKLVAALKRAQPAQKTVLLRVLSGIGGQTALGAVRRAVDDADKEVHTAAIRALGAWETPDAAPELLALAKAATNPSDKMLCLRGYLGMASRRDLPAGRRLSMCREVTGLIQSADEKKLLLSALGSIDSPRVLAMIVPYLDDSAVRAEAGAASVAISERLLRRRDASKVAAQLIEPLEKVVQVMPDSDIGRRARQLLREAKSKAGRN